MAEENIRNTKKVPKPRAEQLSYFDQYLSRYYEHTLYIKQVFRVKYCTGVASIDFFLSF